MVRGAYGVGLVGLPEAAHVLRPVAGSWPTASVQRRTEPRPAVADHVDDSRATYQLHDGGVSVRMLREDLSIECFVDASAADEELVHPYLALAGAVLARWTGREAFHAGAFVHDGGAWAVMGVREAGKSSLMAQLHLMGVPIVTDDVLVLEKGMALPGPGMIDLREGAARHLGVGVGLGVVGSRERWRVRLPEVAGPHPLRGWLLPAWGEACSLQKIPLAARLPMLQRNAALYRPPVDPLAFFDLVGLPVLQWTRPRDLAQLESSTRVLLDSLPS